MSTAEPLTCIDGCPAPGCTNTEAPTTCVPLTAGHRCAYLCTDCGRAWTTDYRGDA